MYILKIEPDLCLQYEIGRCSAPCIGLINKTEYTMEVKRAELLLEGKSKT